MTSMSPRPANWPPRMSARSRTRARSTVTHKETAHSVRRLTKTRPLAAGGATPRVGGHRSADGCLRNPASTSPWYGAEPLRYPACRAIARAAPPRRVRRLYPACLAGIDEGLDHGCAASSAAPSTHGAPGQLGAIDAPCRGATPCARAALRVKVRRAELEAKKAAAVVCGSGALRISWWIRNFEHGTRPSSQSTA